MKKTIVATLLAALIPLSACSALTSGADSGMKISNKEKAVALLNAIETGDQKAVAYVNANNYTQHNLALADGLAGFGEVLQALPKGSAKVNVVRAFADGEYVFSHTDYNFFGPKIGFDIFRFEDGKIVEHWDNLTTKATSVNPSDRTEIDGATHITDLDKTDINKALVGNFVDSILVNGQFDKLTQFFDGDHYIQHNKAIADGLSGLGQALQTMKENGVTMVYKKVHKILGEGNFVLTVSEGEFAGKATSFYDLFRVENNKIVEHWDVIEPILNQQEWKNMNGKFAGF